MLKIINIMFEKGVILTEMKEVIIRMIQKKGDLPLCENWRTISLCNHVVKIVEMMTKFRLEQLAAAVKGCIPLQQFGFTKGQSIIDAELVSRMLSTLAAESRNPIYKAFLDLSKAYDKVDRSL